MHPLSRAPRGFTAIVIMSGLLWLSGPRVLSAMDLPAAPAVFRGNALEDSVAGLRGARFEDAFNQLLHAELEASTRGSLDARSLKTLLDRVAELESRILGSRIARSSLELRRTWSRAEVRARAQAWRDESAGWAARQQRDTELADTLLSAALTGYQVARDRRREAWVLGRLAACAFDRKAMDLALARYAVALDARRSLGDSTLLGNTLSDLGALHLTQGRLALARPLLEEAAAIRTQMRDPRLGATLGYLATVYAATGPIDSARAVFARALEQPLSADRHRDLTLNHARYLIDTGALSEGESQAAHALELASAAGDDRQADLARGLLTSAAFAAGRFSETLERAVAREHTAQAVGDSAAILAARIDQARVYAAALDADRAVALLGPALDLAYQLGDTASVARILINRSVARSTRVLAGESITDATTALQHATASGDSVMVHDACTALGELYRIRGRSADALVWFERAQAALPAMSDRRGLADRLGVAVSHIMLGRLGLAEPVLTAIASSADSSELWDISALARLALADLSWKRGDTLQALELSRQNLERIDQLRSIQRHEESRIGLFADHVDEFESIVHLLVRSSQGTTRSGHLREAFMWAERSRARALLDRGAGTEARTLDLAQVQSHLATDQALLEYSLGDSLSALWVVRADTFMVIELPPRAALRISLARAVSMLRTPSTANDALKREMDRLAQIVLGGKPAMLTSARRWIIVQDGPLALLPFEALRVAGRYVTERHELVYAPSASYHFASRPDQATSRIVALADPDFGPEPRVSQGWSGSAQPLARLTESLAEIAPLEQLPAHGTTTLLTGPAASRRMLLSTPELADACIVHLATHGKADDIEPGRSRLWLAPDSLGGPPSEWTAQEISAFHLNAELVTLAACESGLGEVARGEGVLGFSRAFLGAGAHSVLASLWPVSDQATAKLLRTFYTDLLSKRQDRGTALVRAKRALLAKDATRHPFYWAGFVLIGDDGPLSTPLPISGRSR